MTFFWFKADAGLVYAVGYNLFMLRQVVAMQIAGFGSAVLYLGLQWLDGYEVLNGKCLGYCRFMLVTCFRQVWHMQVNATGFFVLTKQVPRFFF